MMAGAVRLRTHPLFDGGFALPQPINYSVEVIEQCKAGLERLYNCRDNLAFLLKNAPEGEKEGEKEIRRRFSEYQDHFIERWRTI